MKTAEATSLRPIFWHDGRVALMDQTRLPQEEVWLELTDFRDVIGAIQDMQIRGAPAIGVAGAYAVSLAAAELGHCGIDEFMAKLERAAEDIRAARPTGANLAWAVDRMMLVAHEANSVESAVDGLVAEAQSIQSQDEQANLTIGRHGAELVTRGSNVLTHCNAGALATGGHGTALGVIKTAWAQGRLSHVFATETRPLFQGARLTGWELARERIEATVIPDSAAGSLMLDGKVQAVIVGADRIAANGDVANKIGTYSLSVLAKEHGVPFYVAAPTSTIDLSIPSGDKIPIEERSPQEVALVGDVRIVPDGVGVLNLAFDVTPNHLVSAIITEIGVAQAPYGAALGRMVEASVG